MKSFTSIAFLGATALIAAVTANPIQARNEKYTCDYDWTQGGKYKDDSVLIIDDAEFPKKLQYYGDWEHKSWVPDFFKKTVSDTCDGNAYVATLLPKDFDTLVIFGDKCKLGGYFDVYLNDYWVAQGDEYTSDKYDTESSELILAVDLAPTLEKIYPKKKPAAAKRGDYQEPPQKEPPKKEPPKKEPPKKEPPKKEPPKKEPPKKEPPKPAPPKPEPPKEEPVYIIIRNRPFDFRHGGFGYAPKLSIDALVLLDTDVCKEYKDFW